MTETASDGDKEKDQGGKDKNECKKRHTGKAIKPKFNKSA